MEAAGLALAVLPLISSTTEHWKRLYSTGKVVFRQREKDEKLAEDLQWIHFRVELLEIILRSLVEDLPLLTDEQKGLLLNLDAASWKDDTVDLALTQHLGRAKDAFVDCLQSILQTLDSIISDRTLKLIKSDLVTSSLGESTAVFSKLNLLRGERGKTPEGLAERIRYTTNRGTRRRALDQLKRFTDILQDLTKAKDLKSPRTTARTLRRRNHADTKSRKLIKNAYTAMASLWSCNCNPPHEARMCLKRQFDCFDDPSISCLEMFISIEADQEKSRWQEGNVALDPEPTSNRISSAVHVRFQDEQRTKSRRRSSQSLASRKSIESICKLVDEAHQNNTTLEMVFDNESLWQVQAQRKRGLIQELQAGLTLEDMLKESSPLTLKEKRILAVIIANALLDFSESKWCDGDWSKENICFFESKPGNVDIKRPYLSTKFKASADTSNNPRSMVELHPCRQLLGLGVVLLELERVKTIEDMREPNDMTGGKVNVNTDYITARRVLEDSVDDFYEDYKSAVEACLECKWLQKGDVAATFDDEAFRQAVYDEVVVPLEKELSNGFHITLDKLD